MALETPALRTANPLGPRPLYAQVRAVLLDRMIKGLWKAGDSLPSEILLAAELGVSQGTVRKALDDLVGQNLLVRRQGRGTFVNGHNPQRSLFHFFKLVSDRGEHRLPVSQVLEIETSIARAEEIAALELKRNSKVVRVTRIRSLGGRPTIFERISVSAALFPGLGQEGPLPNTLYALDADRFGVTVAEAREQLRAVAANVSVARKLGIATGSPLLEIRRVAVGLDGKPVELRVSLCETRTCRYESLLR
jgi:GntR family transcriptional regulator